MNKDSNTNTGSRESYRRQAPWEEKEWLSGVRMWIHDQLPVNDIKSSDSLKVIKQDRWAAILRIDTKSDILYFKADYPQPPSEPAVISLLSENWSVNVPTIVAMDIDRGWTLMRDFGEVGLSELSINHWVEAIRIFAEMQISCIDHIDHWFKLGCDDLRLNVLDTYIEELLEDTSILMNGPYCLHKNELSALQSKISDFKTTCGMLDEMSIPQTIEQGDFRAGNVAFNNGNYIHYDWGETVVSHPFFSLLGFVASTPVSHTNLPKVQNAFLEPWLEYASKAHVLHAFHLAQQVYPIYRAVWIHRKLLYLNHTSSWYFELSQKVPKVLRHALASNSFN